MSRSKLPQCSAGRGCGCCGDAGLSRRKRDRAWQKADEHDGYPAAQHKGSAHKDAGHPLNRDSYYEGRRHAP
jgi:hypothetical protein